jgi:hypothetical protein
MSKRQPDSFDDLAIPVTKLDVTALLGRPSKKKKDAGFAQFPLAWRSRLKHARHIATLWLALFLLHENWKHPGQLITVSNVAAKDWGDLSREEKREGLAELETLLKGVIVVDRPQKNKSPIVKVLL